MLRIIKSNQRLIIFFSILLVALIFRTIKLSQTPSGFHADEASFLINSLAISQTGMDEDGNALPLSLASIIDPKPALISYFQIPSILVFNDPVFATRFVSVVLSILSILAVYLFVKELAQEKIALLTILVLAISPWHIVVSRGTQEVIASFLFLTLALWLLLLFIRKTKISQKIILLFYFASGFLSMYFYHSAKIIFPLLSVCLIIYHYKKSQFSLKKAGVLLITVVIAGILSLTLQNSTQRIAAVSIFSDSGPQQQLMEQIYTTREQISPEITRVFYNKASAYGTAIIGEYLKYFSPEFLFLSGEQPTRYVVPDHGLLYLIEIPLLFAGIFIAIKNRRKELPVFFAILLLSPIPAALTTQETPSLLRSFPMLLSFSYFVAISLKYILEIKQKNIRYVKIFFIIIFYLWSISYFSLQYHVQAKYTQPWYRNSPYTKIAQKVATIINDYDEIHITNDLRPLYAYFVMEKLISVQELQANSYARYQTDYTLGKFTFNKDVCEFPEIKPHVLYIAEIGCREKNQSLKELNSVAIISYDDGNEVYELLQMAE